MKEDAVTRPVTLTGSHVRLVPLATEHRDGLVSAVRDGALWELWYTSAPAPDAMESEILRLLELHKAGVMLPFTVIDPSSGDIVGMTTYMTSITPIGVSRSVPPGTPNGSSGRD